MEKLLFFERLAAEWTSSSNKTIHLNKDRTITENQKYGNLDVEKLSKKTELHQGWRNLGEKIFSEAKVRFLGETRAKPARKKNFFKK